VSIKSSYIALKLNKEYYIKINISIKAIF